MSLIGELIIEHFPWSEADAAALLTLRVAQGKAGQELNALANELTSLRRPGGVTHDRINAVLGIVPMTTEEARQVVRAALDLRHEPPPPVSPFGEVLAAMTRAMATNVRDWGSDRMDAFLWGVLLGWDCDEQHDHAADFCEDGAMAEIAARHGWDAKQVERVRRFHRAILAAASQPSTATSSKPGGTS